MFTIKKIWNALNHAGKPWQIAIAVALGMLVGFTPLVSAHNIVVLLIVLIFNIHFSIFLLAVSFFGVIGLLLDPLFASIGKTILTSSEFETLFTSWYNDPVGHITYFNNTITMGSFVVSLVLFFFVYKITSYMLVKYRDIIAVKIKNIPLLNKMNFFTQEKQSEVKTLRIAGIVVIVFFVGLISLFNLFILDSLIKSNLENAINKSSTKIVKIGDLSTSFFDSSVSLKKLHISDSKKKDENIYIEDITLDISLGDAIFERIIIDNIKVNGISFPSQTLAKAKPSPAKKTTTSSSKKESKVDISHLNSLKDIKLEKDFDKEIKKQFEKYKNYYNQIKPLFNKEQKVVQKRDDGRFIYFPLKSNLPDFLIKKGTFSILKDNLFINGSFKDFTTNQYLYKKPFVISINTQSEKIGNVIANGSFIETKKINQDRLNLKLDGYPLADQEENNFSISNTVINTQIDLNIVNKNKINGSQSIKVLTTDIKLPETNKYIAILNKSMTKTTGIKADVSLFGTIKSPLFKINSNIDSILKKKIQDVVTSQKDAIKAEVKNKVKDKIKKKLDGKLDKNLKGILGF